MGRSCEAANRAIRTVLNPRSSFDDMQSRFAAFLLHTGADPDRVRNTDYILWISRKWAEWRQMKGLDRWAKISTAQHERFTEWLFETVPKGQLEMQAGMAFGTRGYTGNKKVQRLRNVKPETEIEEHEQLALF